MAKRENNSMVQMPIATVKVLAKMFTSKQGIDLGKIVADLGGNSDLTTINLGLLLQGYNLELPKVKYANYTRSIYVRTLEHVSILKDEVTYTQQQFDFCEEGWKARTYSSQENTSVQAWLEMAEELPEGVVLPEIKD